MNRGTPERTDTTKNRSRLLANLRKPRTANEVIENIFANDKRTRRLGSWKYYLHLNKLFAPMERAGLIRQVGQKKGPTNKIEKLWSKV